MLLGSFQDRNPPAMPGRLLWLACSTTFNASSEDSHGAPTGPGRRARLREGERARHDDPHRLLPALAPRRQPRVVAPHLRRNRQPQTPALRMNSPAASLTVTRYPKERVKAGLHEATSLYIHR